MNFCLYIRYRDFRLGGVLIAKKIKECYREQTPDSPFCMKHKCKTCSAEAEWQGFCLTCKCPIDGCIELAYLCQKRCEMCDQRHRRPEGERPPGEKPIGPEEEYFSGGTCSICRCMLCDRSPVGNGGKYMLCLYHCFCLYSSCHHMIYKDNARYCSQHVPLMKQNLKTLELIFLRLGFPKDIRRLLVKYCRNKFETQTCCKVCGSYFHAVTYTKICDQCKPPPKFTPELSSMTVQERPNKKSKI